MTIHFVFIILEYFLYIHFVFQFLGKEYKEALDVLTVNDPAVVLNKPNEIINSNGDDPNSVSYESFHSNFVHKICFSVTLSLTS